MLQPPSNCQSTACADCQRFPFRSRVAVGLLGVQSLWTVVGEQHACRRITNFTACCTQSPHVASATHLCRLLLLTSAKSKPQSSASAMPFGARTLPIPRQRRPIIERPPVHHRLLYKIEPDRKNLLVHGLIRAVRRCRRVVLLPAAALRRLE
ncbi:uncharacterized protein J3D65DRAFT_641196 [Phyllosticta citribraziliensis]|uniref:Uncharacterized protein n=1 Tax=Phyllosticta citribraziliensis TaxID=989973 RepID=A0ABR1L584_9PEZI